MCFVSQISWLINSSFVCARNTLMFSFCTSPFFVFAQSKSPSGAEVLPWCRITQSSENAFVTLNPCRVSVDDIIVWEHITSPLPRLSLLKTAPPYVYRAAHTCTYKQRERKTRFSVYKCDISINMHINSGQCPYCRCGRFKKLQVGIWIQRHYFETYYWQYWIFLACHSIKTSLITY